MPGQPPPGMPELAAARERGAATFTSRIVTLAPMADQVDRLWQNYKTTCNVTVPAGRFDGTREWIALWDDRELVSDDCIELTRDVARVAGPLSDQLAFALEEARKSWVLPGTTRSILRQYSLDWEGWGRPLPNEFVSPP
jgi:hypothetical protein